MTKSEYIGVLAKAKRRGYWLAGIFALLAIPLMISVYLTMSEPATFNGIEVFASKIMIRLWLVTGSIVVTVICMCLITAAAIIRCPHCRHIILTRWAVTDAISSGNCNGCGEPVFDNEDAL